LLVEGNAKLLFLGYGFLKDAERTLDTLNKDLLHTVPYALHSTEAG
jgi:hypothetical protein